MAFIKHGDGKITHIIKTEELSEEDKKKLEELAESVKKDKKS